MVPSPTRREKGYHMSEFYGQVVGNRGPASRGGSRASGIHVSAQSWDGSVQVKLRRGKDDELQVNVSTSHGSDMYGNTVYFGSLDRFERMCIAEMDEGRFA